MAQLISRGAEAQPLVEVRGRGADGSATRMVILAGHFDVTTDTTGSPARVAGTLRFLVPTAPSLPSTLDPSTLRASVTVHPSGVSPIVQSDIRVRVVSARALFVPDAGGGITLAVESALETLYLASHTARFAYQVVATVPDV
ncbi:MAG: hypothetical protein AMXMBFR64_23360 [Myxococcales bacterium]